MNPLFHKFLVQRRMEYLTVDEELKILETSVGVRRFADAPDEVAVGKDVREAFPELFGMEEYLEAVIAGREVSVDLKGVARFSEPINPLYFDVHIMANEEETDNRLIVFFEDVTEHMVMKQNLVQRSNQANLLLTTVESSMAYIDKIISSMADAMLVTTDRGNIKTVNPAAVKLFGYGEKELIGESIDIIFGTTELWQRLNYDDRVKNVEVRCRSKNGHEIDVAFSCAVIYSDLEESENFIYIGRDISERKRMEAEIQKARNVECRYKTLHKKLHLCL
ncbi:MAG TPA: PAS domain S-box protein [Oscillatoriaceae cyanobacterium M33_DOE_052]|uniref:PAS domain S-box protein n=1 Tax=Planktothricoides sp. SpSt-374 TaxID=2282167 RepID=A0A7C3VPV3_9CYAN|nr:PAS domain S-box protein [Oscillatoriaceae cyanobacterium M33_DOE_052]